MCLASDIGEIGDNEIGDNEVGDNVALRNRTFQTSVDAEEETTMKERCLLRSL